VASSSYAGVPELCVCVCVLYLCVCVEISNDVTAASNAMIFCFSAGAGYVVAWCCFMWMMGVRPENDAVLCYVHVSAPRVSVLRTC
jgi:hypothetical protein